MARICRSLELDDQFHESCHKRAIHLLFRLSKNVLGFGRPPSSGTGGAAGSAAALGADGSAACSARWPTLMRNVEVRGAPLSPQLGAARKADGGVVKSPRQHRHYASFHGFIAFRGREGRVRRF